MEAVRHRQAAQDLASSTSPPSTSTSHGQGHALPASAARERESGNKVHGFQQWYQQVKLSAKPSNKDRDRERHSSTSLITAADRDRDSDPSRGGSVSPNLLGRGSSDANSSHPQNSTRETDAGVGPKLQQQYSISLSESAIPDRTDSIVSLDRGVQGRSLGVWGEGDGDTRETTEGEGDEAGLADSRRSSAGDEANGEGLMEEECEERTGISLLDATSSGSSSGVKAGEQAADTSSYQAALRLLDKKDPKSEITSVPKALKILQVSADLRFDEGMNACLRYLEAVPWSAAEEAEVQAVLAKLGLGHTKAGLRVLARMQPSCADSVHAVLKKLLAQAVAPPSQESLAAARSVVAALLTTAATETPQSHAPSRLGLHDASLPSPGRSLGFGSQSFNGHPSPSGTPVSEGGERKGFQHLGLALPRSHTVAPAQQVLAESVAGSKRMWRVSVEKLFVGSRVKADVRKRVLFEQLDALIDRVQACVLVEGRPGETSQFVHMKVTQAAVLAASHGEEGENSELELSARFRVEMDNLAWLMGTMVEKLGFAEYIVKWLSEDAGFVRNVEYYSHRDNPVECSMYDPLLPILLRLLTLMVGGHILIPTVTRYSLVKLWLPVLAGSPKLPGVLSRERGRLFGELVGQLIVTLPTAQQEEVIDVWLAESGGRYNTWLDMGCFLEKWLERSCKRIRD